MGNELPTLLGFIDRIFMCKHEKYWIATFALIALAWWFRYDINCNGDAHSCVAYDRFTGKLINPNYEASKNRRNEEN